MKVLRGHSRWWRSRAPVNMASRVRARLRRGVVANTVADAAWAIASKPSRRQCPRGKAVLPVVKPVDPGLVSRADRVDDSRGFRVPLASVCPAAAVDIGRSLAAAGGLGAGFVRIAGWGQACFRGPDRETCGEWDPILRTLSDLATRAPRAPFAATTCTPSVPHESVGSRRPSGACPACT